MKCYVWNDNVKYEDTGMKDSSIGWSLCTQQYFLHLRYIVQTYRTHMAHMAQFSGS
jgi:hypothetical protein